MKKPELKTAHILFIDIVGFSKLKSEKQAEQVEVLKKTVQSTISKYPKKNRRAIPTGDGMALAFLDNPEAPLSTALKISSLLKKKKIPVRMGMNIGLVYLVKDINEQRNLAGGGINMAQRVMDCGDEGHILASKTIAEALSQVKEEYENLFHPIGEYEVKHDEKISIYNVYDNVVGNSTSPKQKPVKKAVETLRKESFTNITPPEPNFVGRTEYLETVTGWYKDPDVRIGALVGWGGVGKSSIARRWFDNLEKNKIKPDGIFWWGFYRNALLEPFLDSLLGYLAQGRDVKDATSTWAKVDKIKEFITEGEYLIILDGLEVMQKGQEKGELFGTMEHRECTYILRYLLDAKGKGLCLITSRFPQTDIKPWKGLAYRQKDVDRLSLEDGRALFKKVGVNGSQDEIDKVIEDYKGHALALTSLAGYLNKYYEGKIDKSPDIPFVFSEAERWKDVNKLFKKYSEKMSDGELAFLKIFSLFRLDVSKRDFDGVFRKPIGETELNKSLVEINELDFIDLVQGLVEWRMISFAERKNAYATHPLTKGFFESIFEPEDKKLCHKKIYEYIGTYAPEMPDTLEEMQPLFEQVFHGCRAGLYDAVYYDVYKSKIMRQSKFYLTQKLGAWETDLSLVFSFFPEGNLSEMPLVSTRKSQAWLLNEAGLSLLNTGRPSGAEKTFSLSIEINLEDKDWINASLCYLNLADLLFRTGKIKESVEISRKSLNMAEKGAQKRFYGDPMAYRAYTLFLLGDIKEAGRLFEEANDLKREITPKTGGLYGLNGVQYSDFLLHTGKTGEAFKLSGRNLEFCTQNNLPDDISRCNRSLGAIERIKGGHEKASEHLEEALNIARKVGMPELEIEALLERGRLKLDKKDYEGAEIDSNDVLKLCDRTGFKLYEPDAEVLLAKLYLAQGDKGKATEYAEQAHKKASDMDYHWPKVDAEELLKNIS